MEKYLQYGWPSLGSMQAFISVKKFVQWRHSTILSMIAERSMRPIPLHLSSDPPSFDPKRQQKISAKKWTGSNRGKDTSSDREDQLVVFSQTILPFSKLMHIIIIHHFGSWKSRLFLSFFAENDPAFCFMRMWSRRAFRRNYRSATFTTF